jgi:hypothetical protein
LECEEFFYDKRGTFIEVYYLLRCGTDEVMFEFIEGWDTITSDGGTRLLTLKIKLGCFPGSEFLGEATLLMLGESKFSSWVSLIS